jgi:SAM-dependent methyltransferase
MHAEAYEFVRRAVERTGPFGQVLEIGGRDINGTVRPLFGDAEYVSLDLVEGPGVDVVADAATWDPGPRWFDCVVCCEVLEHASDAAALVARARTWLRPGGALIMTCASDPRAPHSAVDGWELRDGEHYANVSEEDMLAWSEGYSRVTIEHDAGHGDLYAVCLR